MGRRKQFCPQKTGISEANEEEDEASKNEVPSENGEDSQKIKEEDEDEAEMSIKRRPSLEEDGLPHPFRVSPGAADFASSILAAQHSLFHPLLSTSSLYAVQLAQLQAASLLSQHPPLKRKLESSEESPSPLDLSGHQQQKAKRTPSIESSSPSSEGCSSKGKPRHSAWQSQWINRGEENAKDIFKCTWCKECFHSFQALTHHMKETKHFGPSSPGGGAFKTSSPPQVNPPPISPPKVSAAAASVNEEATSRKRDILKEQLPIPRKLVRGQDVWLGKGEEQTRNILKCMWCGESFRSLDVMTKHMQDTKHYTKVISQDQISSWKSGPLAGSSGSPPGQQTTTTTSSLPLNRPPSPTKEAALSSILSCKVCESSFGSLKDLSEHMRHANHCGKSSPGKQRNNPSPPSSSSSVFSFPAKEKRKKSLPVKKLLELERSHEKGATMKFPCDKCGISFPFHLFADHIRNCNGSPTPPPTERHPESPPSSTANNSSSQGVISSEHRSKDTPNILGSLEQMVCGNFKPKEDVVIPVIKGGVDEEDIAVDEEDEHPKGPPKGNNENNNKNPLEALQMLCDKNEKNTSNYYAGQMYGGSSSPPEPPMGPGFPWGGSPEALFKCPFCETPFVSKGAYRNHLSKMHFVKDPSVMMMMDPASIMALASGIPHGGFFTSNGGPPFMGSSLSSSPSPELGEDHSLSNNTSSSSSKFEKYSQLAKQLSNQRKPLSSPA